MNRKLKSSVNNTRYKSQFLRGIMILGLPLLLTTSCKKFIDIGPPPTNITQDNVYTIDATAIAVLNGVFDKLSSDYSYGFNGLSYIEGVSADELSLFAINPSYTPYYTNTLNATGTTATPPFWATGYSRIYVINEAIEGLNRSTTLTPAVKKQLLGEAQFMRAFYYFYLTNFYGDVPLVTATDVAISSTMSRTGQQLVYTQIIEDLKNAQQNLSPVFLDKSLLATSVERITPTQAAATALLARVYLYNKTWDQAETQSSASINNNLFSLPKLDSAFLRNNREAIWQLPAVLSQVNTWEARFFVLPPSGPGSTSIKNAFINSPLLAAFESGDQRKNKWLGSVTPGSITYYFPYKYKVVDNTTTITEYPMVLRLAEQYLIRAEARAQLNNITGALADLNVIRHRAGLVDYAGSNNKDSVISAVLHERQVELFVEWGHRWFDLKRTNTIDNVMTTVAPLKGSTWRSYQQLYPIPTSQLLLNQNLVQNPGY